MTLSRAVPLAVFLASAGCASGIAPLARPTWDPLPGNSPLLVSDLAVGDAWLRHHLMLGDPGTALSLFEPDRPPPVNDALLGALQRAILFREAGELERSNEELEWADGEAERRFTRSVTRTAASFVLSDRVLEYTPTRSEMAMIPFYRMMNYLAMEDVEGAAVEARRIGAMLQREQSSGSIRCWGDGLLEYVAGLTFEAAGELNDAAVSLRRAEVSFEECGSGTGVDRPDGFGRDLARIADSAGLTEIADSARSRYALVSADSAGVPAIQPDWAGEVIVLLEHDFIAHRSAESLHVPVLEDDLDGLDSEDTEEIGIRAAAVTARLLNNFAERERWGSSWDDQPAVRVGHALAGNYVFKLAWPNVAPRQRDRSTSTIRLGELAFEPRRSADLSALARAELQAERQAIIVRLLTRSMVKYLLTREIEQSAEDKGGALLGFVAGRLANYAANETERPDTRSWTLLPDRISVARVSVPAGEVTLELSGAEGAASRPLGPVTVAAGERKLIMVRSIE